MQVDTLIIGAGAAGLMCAAHAGGRVLVVDHARRAGEKIRISGGGRCNFTNIDCEPANFLSQNPHFAKSALARYGPWDFVSLISQAGIAWHEKTLGQLFCDESAKDIVAMLLNMVDQAGAQVMLQTGVEGLRRDRDTDGAGFVAQLRRGDQVQDLRAKRVVLATGGKSIPKMGATGFAYDVARDFGLPVTDTRAGLVPFTFPDQPFAPLSGVALPVSARALTGPEFAEALLFTHRGLSGPAMLQISSYWREGESFEVDLLPGQDGFALLRAARHENGRRSPARALSTMIPARLADAICDEMALRGNMADLPDKVLREVAARLHRWQVTPGGTEGYRTAEVTLGGVDTDALSSQTMEAKSVPGLYFIGECVDVTGWLGGYNFQWAWASAMAAAKAM
jgi:predicted Rossmann fold flavoprotein